MSTYKEFYEEYEEYEEYNILGNRLKHAKWFTFTKNYIKDH